MSAPNLRTPKAATDSKNSIGTHRIPTWTTPLIVLLFVTALFPLAPFLAHICSLGVGYICKRFRPTSASLQSTHSLSTSKPNTFPDPILTSVTDGLGYLKILAPPEKVLRWLEGKLNLLGRLPHYVSIDQKTYGRYGVLPTTNAPAVSGAGEGPVPMTYLGSTQRLGP